MYEGWQWEAEGYKCQGYWGDRSSAMWAAQNTVPTHKAFRVFHGPVPSRRKEQHRLVSPWIDGRRPSGDAIFYLGGPCNIEYREVDA